MKSGKSLNIHDDISKYINRKVYVKLVGGKEVVGVLSRYDSQLNLVLSEPEEGWEYGKYIFCVRHSITSIFLLE